MFTEDLEGALNLALRTTRTGATVLLLFDDMMDVNEHFQAVLDWFKDNGNKMDRRWGTGCKMQSGWIYFAGADTHCDSNGNSIPTRGVALEVDLRPWSAQLIRQTGFEARLREKGLA